MDGCFRSLLFFCLSYCMRRGLTRRTTWHGGGTLSGSTGRTPTRAEDTYQIRYVKNKGTTEGLPLPISGLFQSLSDGLQQLLAALYSSHTTDNSTVLFSSCSLRCACQMTYSPGLNTYYFRNLPKSVTMKYMEKREWAQAPSSFLSSSSLFFFFFFSLLPLPFGA